MTLSPHIFDQLSDPQAAFDHLLRQDFGMFLRKAFPTISGGAELEWNWHLDAIAYQLSRVESGDILRLLVTLPPRNLKSIMISVAWVAWMLGRDPSLRFVCVSYSGELAGKLARDCLAIMQSTWYRALFPGTIISAKRSANHDFETTKGGGRMATSVTGTLTGRGGDIIIIDDPIKPDEAQSEAVRSSVNDWYRTTLASRLNDKRTGAIICVMQRLHQYDLAGMMLEDGGWEHLSFPAIATTHEAIDLPRGRKYYRREGEVLHAKRESLKTLERIKRDQGSVIFEAQYQQNPVPATGNMIAAEWLISYEPADLPKQGQIIQSWDTASKDGVHNDYSVCITALRLNKYIYIIDVFRKKLTFPELNKAAIRLACDQKANVLLIEDAASGQQLYQTLRAATTPGVPTPLKQKPEGDKVSRLSGVSAIIEGGTMLLPSAAPWLAEFKSELLGFPNARHDDQVDALSQLLAYARRQWANHSDAPPVPPILYIANDDGDIITHPDTIFGEDYGDDYDIDYVHYDPMRPNPYGY